MKEQRLLRAEASASRPAQGEGRRRVLATRARAVPEGSTLPPPPSPSAQMELAYKTGDRVRAQRIAARLEPDDPLAPKAPRAPKR